MTGEPALEDCMDLTEAVWALEGGYCLWVGAGISRQVAAGHADVPLWDQVPQEMESAARIQPIEGEDFPTRLDRCLRALGEDAFRRLLRERYYTQLSEGLLSQALDSVEVEDFVPEHVRAVAALGQLANPIVSFNIEPLSSLLLARPAGPVRIVFQQPQSKPSHTWREPGGRFQRLVYHPHGLATADSVMTAGQYESNRETLAFTLAIHAAFGNTLVIVGMSLNDDYLRQQIQEFRASLGDIYWFDSQFPERLATWAARQEINTVQVNWPEFWSHWQQLPVAIDRSDLRVAWYLAVDEAAAEALGGSIGDLERSLLHRSEANIPENLRRLAEVMADAGRRAGEPGTPRLVKGKDPRTIEMAVRKRMQASSIPIPVISKTYDPRVT
jgi:SIR2-like domain